MKEIGTTLARQDSLRMATLGREANKQDSTISEIRKNILANMAQQDNPYEDQDIWNDLSEAGSEMKNVFNEMTNNYFTENSFLSAVGNLMKSWIHGNKAFSILALLPLFTISTRLSFCRTSIGRRLNLTENFFAQVYIACQILWISLLILPFTGGDTTSQTTLAPSTVGAPTVTVPLLSTNNTFSNSTVAPFSAF